MACLDGWRSSRRGGQQTISFVQPHMRRWTQTSRLRRSSLSTEESSRTRDYEVKVRLGSVRRANVCFR